MSGDSLSKHADKFIQWMASPFKDEEEVPNHVARETPKKCSMCEGARESRDSMVADHRVPKRAELPSLDQIGLTPVRQTSSMPVSRTQFTLPPLSPRDRSTAPLPSGTLKASLTLPPLSPSRSPNNFILPPLSPSSGPSKFVLPPLSPSRSRSSNNLVLPPTVSPRRVSGTQMTLPTIPQLPPPTSSLPMLNLSTPMKRAPEYLTL